MAAHAELVADAPEVASTPVPIPLQPTWRGSAIPYPGASWVVLGVSKALQRSRHGPVQFDPLLRGEVRVSMKVTSVIPSPLLDKRSRVAQRSPRALDQATGGVIFDSSLAIGTSDSTARPHADQGLLFSAPFLGGIDHLGQQVGNQSAT